MVRGAGRADPFLSQCEPRPEPPSDEGSLERWKRWPGNMKQCLLFLSSLVPFVLAPRPPDEPSFGSPQRLGKDPGSWLRPAPGARSALLSGKSGSRSRRLGAGCWATEERPKVFWGPGGCGLGFRERMETGLSLNGKGVLEAASGRDGGPGRGLLPRLAFGKEAEGWGRCAPVPARLRCWRSPGRAVAPRLF